MAKKPTFDEVINAAAPERNWRVRDTLRFHYFSPRGLVARKNANDERIAALVDAGIVPSGWHLAYGTFSSREAEELKRVAMLRRTTRIKASVAIDMLRRHCEQQEAKISEAEARASAA